MQKGQESSIGGWSNQTETTSKSPSAGQDPPRIVVLPDDDDDDVMDNKT